MDDLDTTDWERYKTDPTYKAERDAKRRSQGKSVNQHIRNRVVKNFIMSEELLKKAQDDTEELRQQKKALEDDIETLRVRKRKLKDEVATTLTEANSDAQTIRDEAKRQANAITERARQNAQQMLAQREKDLDEKEKELKAQENASDSAKLQRALKFMKTCTLPNSTTTVLASFEAKERLLGYGTKPKRTRAQIQSSANDLYNRINQRQHSDDSYGY
jgi:DNA repair exonuclease SbcCD ATPase subunit